MEKLEKLYEGKAKKMYATDDPEVLWVEYSNQATAFNGEKKEQIAGKGQLNNRITTVLFDLLKARGVESHFIKQINETDQLVRKMTMFPLEIIMRNVAAGSFAKRYGVEEGTELKKPILEFCLKSDDLGDPFINDDGIIALGIATEEELAEISRQAREVNKQLSDIFSKIDVKLVDFKIEEGKTSDGTILLADEITPDTCRLWDQKDHSGKVEHLDKDLFRRGLGSIIPAYEEIDSRLEALAKAEGVEIK
ncbi:phosphoribosylaminoimidazolesuccinocarboxamide synthase [Bifidobacterium simiarum]|uniref:Phosphoribosylaminoimidazole-succinocarboxamide synthase n=1 Tax=Bifidobacterium simiarum TaxID=2045441 RepID=A0A2M9HGX8_9BIFI|nr:phosphoribosylaminoimidazolesuccinocarboxamide synthase [Bifidobacterium simiarum]MBT1165433.1 phosphoribosylaminoimidazolesuccinocarboxamide synthase [Bifidobacterium simiarum]PJM76078.1 phosphoribosylaminoimidazolesuccinocarboxamide synthase [Bifidobacterium simiarum]